MTLWKITCEEKKYPGLWQHWFREQCVAVGWAPQDGYHFKGKTRADNGWVRARNSLYQMKAGDNVLVALHGHRVARLGTILKLNVGDKSWNPFVP